MINVHFIGSSKPFFSNPQISASLTIAYYFFVRTINFPPSTRTKSKTGQVIKQQISIT